MQNESERAILDFTKDAAAEAMMYLLGFPTIAERRKIAQGKIVLKESEDEKHTLQSKVGQIPQSKLKSGAEWMRKTTKTIEKIVSEGVLRGPAKITNKKTPQISLPQYFRPQASRMGSRRNKPNQRGLYF